MGISSQGPELASAAIPGLKQREGLEVEQLGLELGSK